MRVDVVYALAHVQDVVSVALPEGSTASQAVAASGMRERHGLAAKPRLAIFGKTVALDHVLRAGDRVEILRNLAADPNAARRARARRSTRV